MASITILGKRYTLRFPRRLKHRADCSDPSEPNRTIRIQSSYRGRELIELVIHETLHAAAWHLDEDAVTRFAADCSAAITKPEIWERITDGDLLPNKGE